MKYSEIQLSTADEIQMNQRISTMKLKCTLNTFLCKNIDIEIWSSELHEMNQRLSINENKMYIDAYFMNLCNTGYSKLSV